LAIINAQGNNPGKVDFSIAYLLGGCHCSAKGKSGNASEGNNFFGEHLVDEVLVIYGYMGLLGRINKKSAQRNEKAADEADEGSCIKQNFPPCLKLKYRHRTPPGSLKAQPMSAHDNFKKKNRCDVIDAKSLRNDLAMF
jgi:hypothetical protein